MTTPCSVEGCHRLSINIRGMCGAHYSRMRRYGDPKVGRCLNGARGKFLSVALAFNGDGCLFWPFPRGKAGYATIWKDGRMVKVSRVICAEVNGPPPSQSHGALHSCGNGHLGCVAKKHLRWGTQAENNMDSEIHGTRVRGEKHPLAVLTEVDVLTIRSLTKSATQASVAKQFGIGDGHINAIVHRKIWKHI